MTWQDKLKNPMIIITGDGREYRPNWLNAVKSGEYNVSEFEFIGVSGTYAPRSLPKGRKFNLEIYFQGENHLDDAERFEVSAADKRPWKWTHPFYGLLIVVPISLSFDDTDLNVTKVTGTLTETIVDGGPNISINRVDKILGDSAILIEKFSISTLGSIPRPSTAVITEMKKNNLSLYNQGKLFVQTNDDSQLYFNLFNQANAAITNATADPLAAIRALQAVINAPSLFQATVKNRIDCIVSQFNILTSGINTLLSPSSKKVYENNAGSAVGSMAQASVTNYDYKNRTEVVSTIGKIIDTYNAYITGIDSLQTPNGGKEDSYIPDFETISSLNSLVNYTIANLFQIANDAKQERFIYLEKDSNWIIITHRLVGLNPDDLTINDLIELNNGTLEEMLQVKKGRKIVWYV